MYFSYKNFDGIIDDIIEITSSDSALGLLNKNNNKNIKVCLPLSLSIGRLELLQKRNTITKYDFTNDFDILKEKVKTIKKIRVWTSHLDCDEYCLLLLICYLYKDKTITAIFYDENDEYYDLKKEQILSETEKENYSNEWKKLVKDNKELRYMLNKKAISCDIDTFDDEILKRLNKLGKVTTNELVISLMSNPIRKNINYSSSIYKYLINRLEKINKINTSIISNTKYIETKEKY